jgi:hypothetical protein
LFPAKIHVGQIAAVFRIDGVSMWGATQWAARARGHQVGLGAASFRLWAREATGVDLNLESGASPNSLLFAEQSLFYKRFSLLM